MQSSREADSTGQIILGATPIGNPADASARLIEWLETADLVAAEDTRRLHKLTGSLGIRVSGRIFSYHEHNELSRTAELIEQVRSGATLLMVSDAGMPAVSDPGYRLVQAAIEARVRVTAIPGPSAVLTALALSGLPTDRFSFEGFLPRKAGERKGKLQQMAGEQRTMIFFEAPHRLEAMLAALVESFGPERKAAVARELTKTFEEVLRGSLQELHEWAASSEVRGEIAVVVGGSHGIVRSAEEQVAAVLELAEGGMRLKDAVAVVAESSQASKRELYEAVLAARAGS
ncbi:16S rRNA (cytidine(1402)-2'-O)-methyltransferase [Psychromicrobium sp. YIM B11713]|uniref:16S rRNA (cytidine(1402)-2'-O)-methyltransferase n=1 Tax=Psychromicrobium sp. YIM B11713 TaxID=3145233 RepID=UPI00374E38C5